MGLQRKSIARSTLLSGYLGKSGPYLGLNVKNVIFQDGWFGTAGQLLFVQIQLMMIVGLCLDGGRSLFSKFYKTRIMQFLGRISMSLYLVHEPIIYYINWVYFGSVKWLKDEDSPTNFAKPDYVKMPTQYVPVHICISLLAGIFLTLCIEEPARKFLTKKLRKA